MSDYSGEAMGLTESVGPLQSINIHWYIDEIKNITSD